MSKTTLPFVAVLLFTWACSSGGTGSGASDAGPGGSDAGASAPDAGSPGADAGSDFDAGTPGTDGGMSTGLAVDPAAFCQSAPAGAWNFRQSEITGGGQAMVVAAHPTLAGYAAVGGDSWGLYNSATAGNLWLPAERPQGGAPVSAQAGEDYFSGLAWSQNPSQPLTLYGLVGRCGAAGGGFLVVRGDAVQSFVTSGPVGGEPNCNRTVYPRPVGNRVVTYWDAAASVEVIYSATGNGEGVWRSVDGAKTWVHVYAPGSGPIITGMALVPGTGGDALVVATQSTLVRLIGLRAAAAGGASAASIPLPSGVQDFEEVSAANGKLYAAARLRGVWTSSDGQQWAQAGQGIPSTVDIVSVAGSANGALLVAGCNAGTSSGGACIYVSKDGAATWTAAATQPSLVEWGSGQTWWHAAKNPSAMINGGGYVANSISIGKDGTSVYVAGKAGVWKSEDSGATWRPAVVGLGGTMHNVLAQDGTSLDTDDVDFGCEMELLSDAFLTSASIQNPSSCAALSGRKPQLSTSGNGKTFQVVPPDASGNPAQFRVNGVDLANDWFKAQELRPSDVFYDAASQRLFIANFGGGVVVGSPCP